MASDKTPAVSVLLSVWNRELFIRQTVQSILGQTFTDFEFIIIDDGSTDGSLKILEKFARQDNRIHLISRENKGITASLNEGLKLVRAPLVALLDSDDSASEERLALQVAEFKRRPELVLLGGQALYVNDKNQPIEIHRNPTGHANITNALQYSCPFINSSVMYCRKTVLEIDGYCSVFPCAEDLELWLRLSRQGEIDNLSEVITTYRLHQNSLSVRSGEKLVIFSALARATDYLHTCGLPAPVEQFATPPENLSAALALYNDTQARNQFKFSYDYAHLLSRLMEKNKIREVVTKYLDDDANDNRTLHDPNFVGEVLIRTMNKFIRQRQFGKAIYICFWSLRILPKIFLKALIRAVVKRFFPNF